MAQNNIWQDPRLRATATAWACYYTAQTRHPELVGEHVDDSAPLEWRLHTAVVLDFIVPHLLDDVPIDWQRVGDAIVAVQPPDPSGPRHARISAVLDPSDPTLVTLLPWAVLCVLPVEQDVSVELLRQVADLDRVGRDRRWASRSSGTPLERLRTRITAAEYETRRILVLAICGIRAPDEFQPLRRSRSLPPDVSRALRDASQILDLDDAVERVREWRHASFDVDHPVMSHGWGYGGPYVHQGGLLSAVLLCMLQCRLELGRLDRDRALEILRDDWDAGYLDGWVPRVPHRPEQVSGGRASPLELIRRWEDAVTQLERITYQPSESRPLWTLPSRHRRSARPVDAYVLHRRVELFERRRDIATTHGPLRYAARCDIGTYWFSAEPELTGRGRPGWIAVLSDSGDKPDLSVCPSLSEIFERWEAVRRSVAEALPKVIRAWNGVHSESWLPLPPTVEPGADDLPDGWTVRQMDVIGLRPGSSHFEVRFMPLLPRSSYGDWRRSLLIRVIVQEDSSFRVSIEPPERPICADLPPLGDRFEPYVVPKVRRSERARAWGLRRLAELVGDATYEDLVVKERAVRMYRVDADTCIWVDERMFDGRGRKWLWLIGSPDDDGVPRDLPEPGRFGLIVGGLLYPDPRMGEYLDRAEYALRACSPEVSSDELELVADFIEYDCHRDVCCVRVFFPTDPLEHLSIDNSGDDPRQQYVTHA